MKQLSCPKRRGRRTWLACAAAAAVAFPAGASAVIQTWQTSPVSDTSRAASTPTAFVDATGATTAVWLQSDGSTTRVAVAMRPVATHEWPAPAPARFISQAGQNAAGLAVAGNAKGDVVAVWRVGSTVKESHRFGLTGRWSPPRDLRAAAAAPATISVALNDQRDAVVAWIDGTSIWTSSRAGAHPFGAATKLTTVATTRIDHLFTGMDPLGSAHVAWDQMQSGSNGTHLGVYLAKRPFGSTTWIRSARTNLTFDTKVTSLAVRGSGVALLGTQQRSGATAKAVVVPYKLTATTVVAGTAKQFGATSVATVNPVATMNTKGDGLVGYLSTTDQSTYQVRLASYTRSTDSWTTPITIASGPMQQGLGVALSFTGIGMAAWSESSGGTRRIRETVQRSAATPWENAITVDSGGGANLNGLSERGGHFIAAWTDSMSGTTVANVGLLDTVAPKVTPGFGRIIPVREPSTLIMNATDDASAIARYDWTFWDDSPPATGRVVVHRFQRVGNFRVTLKATDAAGNITRTQVIVKVVNFAAVRGFPILGTTLTCQTSIPGASFTWRRGATVLGQRRRHIVSAADLGTKVSCIAHTTKQTANSRGRLVPRMCRVPAVVGKPTLVARNALRLRGCRAAVTAVAAGPAKVGKVIGSAVPAGRLLANGTLVRLRVGS